MINLKSLLSEIHWHKEAKKDYLFKQTKLHSSNTVPTFTEIWKALSKEDGLKDEIAWRLDNIPLTTEPVDKEAIRLEMMKEMEDVQRDRYFEVVNEYKNLEGDFCWRTMMIPHTVDPRKLEQLGIFWAVQKNAAEAHWGKYNGKTITCRYEAVIELKNVDWTGTMFARMSYVGGDDEQEIRFLKNAPLMVRSVDVAGKTYFINNRRRA